MVRGSSPGLLPARSVVRSFHRSVIAVAPSQVSQGGGTLGPSRSQTKIYPGVVWGPPQNVGMSLVISGVTVRPNFRNGAYLMRGCCSQVHCAFRPTNGTRCSPTTQSHSSWHLHSVLQPPTTLEHRWRRTRDCGSLRRFAFPTSTKYHQDGPASGQGASCTFRTPESGNDTGSFARLIIPPR